MAVEVGARLLKDHGDKDYTRAFSQAFTTFPKEVGFNNPLSTPQPGFVQGPRMAQFHLFLVHKHIDGAVLYSDDRLSVTLPHLAGGWGGRGKDMKRAALQAGYNGAAPVYARNKALSYLEQPDPYGHAEVTTFTTDGTTINFFAHYAAPSQNDDSMLEYHQYQYDSANIRDSYQGYKDGLRGHPEPTRPREKAVMRLEGPPEGALEAGSRWRPPLAAEAAPLPSLDDSVERPFPTEETNPRPDGDNDDGEAEQLHPPARPKRAKRNSARMARGTAAELGFEIVDKPSSAPTPLLSSEEPRRSARLSKLRR